MLLTLLPLSALSNPNSYQKQPEQLRANPINGELAPSLAQSLTQSPAQKQTSRPLPLIEVSPTLHLANDSAHRVPLANYLEKRIAAKTTTSIRSIPDYNEVSNPYSPLWQPVYKYYKLIVPKPETHWYRLRLDNPGQQSRSYILSIEPDQILSAASVIFYDGADNTNHKPTAITPKLIKANEFYHRQSSQPHAMDYQFSINPGQTATLLINVATDNWIFPNFTLYTAAELAQARAKEVNYWKVITGIFIGMIFFIVSSTIVTKHGGLLWLLSYSFASIGFVPNFLMINLSGLGLTSEQLGKLSICSGIIAAVCYFGILKSALKSHPLIALLKNRWLFAAIILFTAIGALIPFAYAGTFMRALIVLNAIVAITISFHAYLLGNRMAAPVIGLTKLTLFLMLIFAFFQAGIGTLSDMQLQLWLASAVMLEAAILEIMLMVLEGRRRTHALVRSINAAKKEQHIAAISPFFGGNRHDLRASLSDIIGLAELIIESPLDQTQRKNMLEIQRSGHSALDNIDALFSIQSADQQRPHNPEPFKLSTLLSECTQYYGFRAGELNKEIIVELSLDAPEYWSGSHEYIRQLLMHTLEYFLAASHVTEIRIKPCNFAAESMDITFLLTLDIQHSNRPYSFEQDTALVESIARKLSGELHIEQQQDHLIINAHLPATQNANRSRQQYDLDLLKNRRILILDDSTTSCEVIESYLDRWNVISFKTSDFNTALATIRHQSSINQPIDLALIDFVMPGINGIEASQLLRASPDVPSDLAIIIMSNAASSIDLINVKNHGIKRVLDKPVLAHTLQLVLLEEFYFLHSLQDGLTPTQAAADDIKHHKAIASAQLLLVEDNPVSAKIVGVMLNKLGIDYQHVVSGNEALAKVRSEHFDIILMDCDLPDASGFDTTRQIRAYQQQLIDNPDKASEKNLSQTHTTAANMNQSPIVIIALTAYDTSECEQQCLAAGMDEYLCKPINLSQLQAVIYRALNQTAH